MPVATGNSQILTEEHVIEGFHKFLQTALAQAKAEKLLDADTLASAEADLMVSGPALCLFFGALRSTTEPPSVPLPRSRSDKSLEPARLSKDTCPPAFLPFLQVWASSVPAIQKLPSQHQHDLARIICNLNPLSQPVYSGLGGIAADLRAVAIEISQRRTFQERYQADLQAALDAGQLGRGTRRGSSATAHFVPPPISYLDRAPSLKAESALTIIRETLFAALADVITQTPSLARALQTDPPRAYFSSVALAILEVALTSLTPEGGVRGVLGRELTLDDCPPPLKPLMMELAALGREAQTYATEDDEDAMRLVGEGRDIPEPRMERVRKVLESGVGYAQGDENGDEGRRSVEGRAVQFSTRVNRLALTMTGLPAFRSYAKDVFDVLGSLG
ncbi:hypothetical protein BU17DRAFT_77991 [Hysterangium stoloniferum]|nr:hypothetical protein BU17DRAFT_77991 [Hysterangium stoloniferum]